MTGSHLEIISTILAYLIGGLPFGYLFVRFSLGKDVRTMGSGNIGATNVHRTAGKKAGIIVLLLDIVKGFLAVWIAGSHHARRHRWPCAGGRGCHGRALLPCSPGIQGRQSSCLLHRGISLFGSGILAHHGPYLSLRWSRSRSTFPSASITGALLFPVVMWFVQHPPKPLLFAAIFSALLIVYRHHANIGRLLRGTENVFSLKSRAT